MSQKLQEQIYRSHFPNLPSHEKLLLAYLALKASDDGTGIYPGIDTICLAMEKKKRWILEMLKALEQKGYIIRTSTMTGRGHMTIWHIPLDGKGNIAPRPLAIGETAKERGKGRQIEIVRTEEESELDHIFEEEEEQTPPTPAQTPPPARHLPAVVGNQALIASQVTLSSELDQQTAEKQKVWLELLMDSLKAEPGTASERWYENALTRLRDDMNGNLTARGFEVVDGELQKQIATCVRDLRRKEAWFRASADLGADHPRYIKRAEEVAQMQYLLNETLLKITRRRKGTGTDGR